MSGIAYDLNKIRAFVFDVDGVLSPSVVPTGDDGQPLRMSNVKDGYAIVQALRHGYKICIISGGTSEAVRRRYLSLGIPDVHMCVSDKLPVLCKWMEEHGLKPEEIAVMGDDIPDLRILRHAGLSACPYDASAEVRAEAAYISRFTGGYGCVRDLIEQTLRASGLWLSDEGSLLW